MALDDEVIEPLVEPLNEFNEEVVEATAIEGDHLPPRSGAQSRLISRVLTPAVRFWVRSQLEHVEDLHITIEAGDRQILGGGISQVSASASKAIYQGLHFSHAQVTGQEIQTNLGQMLRGKPFRLLSAFPVVGQVSLSETDLNASLNAPLLANAVTDFLFTLLQQDDQLSTASGTTSARLRDVQVQLGDNELTLTAVMVTPGAEQSIAVRTGLAVKNGNLLKLEGFQHRSSIDELRPVHECTTKFTFPLGSDVHLEQLVIQDDRLICKGRLLVRPGE